MNPPFQAPTRPLALSDARAAGVSFPVACDRASAVLNAAGGVRDSRRTPERPEVLS
jgi:hypothetical protein